MGSSEVPGAELRRVVVRAGEPNPKGEFVLYWMQANRRASSNVALDEAIRCANERGLPVVVYEGLRPDYPEANARIHTFVVQGMRANRKDAVRRGLAYVAYVPSAQSVDRNAIAKLAARAALVVTDDCPAFIYRRQTEALARKIACPLLAVDACGVVPLREMAKREWSAGTIRPKLTRLLPIYLRDHPDLGVDRDGTDLDVAFDGSTDVARTTVAEIVARAGVDDSVKPSPLYEGGRDAAGARLKQFVAARFDRYATDRNDAGVEATSRLSGYLHFGFVSALEVALAARNAHASDADRESFLEELIVRRELAYNFCHFEPEHTKVSSLPEWARKTLAKHARDPRERVTSGQIERGETYDEIWNLAQRELLATGEIHNASRMLWGKKILEWSATPQKAVDTMIRLHHRYALDGRNPATYSNILWILGLHDRAWGPERPVFGTVRYMSSDAFRRKHSWKLYRAFVERAEALANAR